MSAVSFDRIAPYYDILAGVVFDKSIRRAQLHFLDQIPPGARVLVVGGGTGWLLTELLRKPEVTHVTYLEDSGQMLALARRKVGEDALTRVRFIHSNEPEPTLEGHFSVIITNFVLDMYAGEALDGLMNRLAAHLSPDGKWLFTDFRLSPQKRHRWWQWLMTRAMYGFFHLTAGINWQSLPSYHWHFTKHRFRMTHEQSFYGDFMVSRVYKAARE